MTTMSVIIPILLSATSILFGSTYAQTQPPPLPFQTEACVAGHPFGMCRNDFINASSTLGPGDVEMACKNRGTYLACTEAAVCKCQYPNDHPLLIQTYKEMMRMIYEMGLDGCSKYATGYNPQPGIMCKNETQRSPDNYRIRQISSQEQFIQNLASQCPAVGQCFANKDKDFENAIYAKDLGALCGGYEAFFECYETAVCGCKKETEEEMLLVNNFEKRDYVGLCAVVTGTTTFVPEFACGGKCSLSEPGIMCQQEFEKNSGRSKSEKEFCGHLVTYAKCYEDVVCECGLYQRQQSYTTIADAKYTFEVRSGCLQYPEIVFPATQQNGFQCPDDTSVSNDKKKVQLTTSSEEFARVEDELCPGVVDCFLDFDTHGSAALNSKNITSICDAYAKEVVCLEETTCACGTFFTRFLETLDAKRFNLNTLCGDVIPPVAPANCVDKSLCDNPTPITSCDNLLNRQPQQGQDPRVVICENDLQYASCVMDISCRCGLISNGSSSSAFEVYKLLNDVAALYDRTGCITITGHLPGGDGAGIVCQEEGPVDESKKKLVLSWARSPERVSKVSSCPTLQQCFDEDDHTRAEALYNRDYKRTCRNQLNLIKCEEEAYCNCDLLNDANITHTLQEKIVFHNYDCASYAPYGIDYSCGGKSVCEKATSMDTCMSRVTDPADQEARCIEFSNYLYCAHDVACTCDLLVDGSSEMAERVYRNLAKVLYTMFEEKCPLNIPEMLIRPGFDCFGGDALPQQTRPIKVTFSKNSQIQQWSAKCPAIVSCATQYDQTRSERLNAKDYVGICSTSNLLIQCVRQSVCDCGQSGTADAMALDKYLVEMHGDCQAVAILGSSECGSIGKGGGIVDPGFPPEQGGGNTDAGRKTTAKPLPKPSGNNNNNNNNVGGGETASSTDKNGASPTSATLSLLMWLLVFSVLSFSFVFQI